MKKLTKGGTYVVPECKIVDIQTEKGLCLSGGASHGGFGDGGQYEW